MKLRIFLEHPNESFRNWEISEFDASSAPDVGRQLPQLPADFGLGTRVLLGLHRRVAKV